MYSKMIKDKKIRISNENYKKLLKRFDKNNFKAAGNTFVTSMTNETPCALCETFRTLIYEGGCRRCPFAVFQTGLSGCMSILYGLSDLTYLSMDLVKVTYNRRYKRAALKELKIITDFLKSFKKE